MKTLAYFASGQYYPDYQKLPYDQVILIDKELQCPFSTASQFHDPIPERRSARIARSGLSPQNGGKPFSNCPSNIEIQDTQMLPNHSRDLCQDCNNISVDAPLIGDYIQSLWFNWQSVVDKNIHGSCDDLQILQLKDHVFQYHLVESPELRPIRIWKHGKVQGWKMECLEALKLCELLAITIDCFVCINDGSFSEGGGLYPINSAPFMRQAEPVLAKDYIHVMSNQYYSSKKFMPKFHETMKEIFKGDEGWFNCKPLMHYFKLKTQTYRRVKCNDWR